MLWDGIIYELSERIRIEVIGALRGCKQLDTVCLPGLLPADRVQGARHGIFESFLATGALKQLGELDRTNCQPWT